MSLLADTSVGTGHAVAFRTNYLWPLQKSGAHPPQCVTMYRVNTAVVVSLLALLQTVVKSNSNSPRVCPSVLLFVRIEESQSHRAGVLQIIFGVYIKILK
jgi:hypothetical protein